MSEEKQEKVVLAGEEAMELWREGKEAWNTWVDENPEAAVDFSGMHFRHNDGGKVSFESRRFPAGGGEVNFAKTSFEVGYVVFKDVKFGNGRVSFYDAEFGDGPVDFSGAVFGDGDADFAYMNVKNGVTTFSGSKFGSGRFDFRNSYFGGPVRFLELRGTENCQLFRFEGARFEQLFNLTLKGNLGCPLDLRRTSMSHDMVVSDIECDFAVEPTPKWTAFLRSLSPKIIAQNPRRWRWASKAKDREDSQRFCRLKELAISNRNYAKALEFHTKEIQSRRGHETKWWQDLVQFVFWFLGGYGRSIKRPITSIAVGLAAFAGLFWWFRVPIGEMKALLPKEEVASFSRDGLDAITYSGSHMLAFIPVGRTARSQGEVALFAGETPNYILILGAIESIVGVILLFLLSLSLRNLFRV